MTLDDLKKQAAKILAVEPATRWEYHTFSTNSGPLKIDVELGSAMIHRDQKFRYNTVRHGAAFRSSVTIEARKLDASDVEGLPIYEASNGQVFVYDHAPGSPEYFDAGRIRAPKMEV